MSSLTDKIKRPEKDVLRAVEAFLKARGMLCFRMNSGATFLSYKGKMRCIRGNPSGTADLLTFIGSLPVWAECKSSEGKQSEIQKQFQAMVEKEGHVYLLVRSAAEVEDWIQEINQIGSPLLFSLLES